MKFPPIVSFEEMSMIEKEAFSKGVLIDHVIEEVARGIEEWVASFLSQRELPKTICIFAGKGNNGADALLSALFLKRKGIDVSIVLPFETSLLCEKSKTLISKLKQVGAHFPSLQEVKQHSFSIVIDGLLGVGVKKGIQEPLTGAIEQINSMESIIVSIDLPSGMHEDYQRGETVVRADFTLYVSLPKRCYFESESWEKVGKLVEIRIPSFEPYYSSKQSRDFLIQKRSLAHAIGSKRNLNKYEAGYLLLLAGSEGMKGAAKLTAEAAYRSGCGIIRIFGPSLELAEVISEQRNIDRFKEELKRASCVCMGPGLGSDAETKQFFTEALNACTPNIPLVLDADALGMLNNLDQVAPRDTILTPHYGELLKLLGLDKSVHQQEAFEAARRYAQKHHVVLICKGSPTRIYSQEGICFVSSEGDPAMATAGMGDVLSGVLAGFLSRGLTPLEAATTGVYLHAMASLQSLEEWGMFHLLASDCIKELSKTISKFFHKH